MLNIYELPDTLSEFDLEQIELIQNDPESTLRIYNDEINYKNHNNNKNQENFKVIRPVIFMNATVEESISISTKTSINDEELILPKSLFSIIPVGNLFDAFKDSLNIVPVFNGEDLNVENEFISSLNVDVIDEDYVIYDPQTNVFIFYNLDREHRFKVFHGEEEYYFDSIDLALKYPYEKALRMGFKLENKNTEMLDKVFSDGEYDDEVVDELTTEINNKDYLIQDFIKSGRYDSLLKTIEQDFKLRNIESVSSEDFYNLKELVTFLDEDEFNLMVDISLSGEGVISNPLYSFENYEKQVKNLRFNKIIENGTLKIISLAA